MSAYLIYKVVGAESVDALNYLDLAFWPIAALILVIATSPITVAALNRYFRFIFFYALASTLIEVILFLTIGRLPALAYVNSISVRFGGFLDDPNGFAALIYMLMGWAYYSFSGKKRLFAEIALLFCILLTQSFTAFGFLVLLALVFAGYHQVRKPRPFLVMSLVALFSIILISVWSPLIRLISLLIKLRSGSADVHLAQVTTTKMATGAYWFFGLPYYVSYESWWVGSLINFGIPWYLLSLVVIGMLVFFTFRAFRKARRTPYKAVISGIWMLSCYFLVGSVNLPYFKVFPINFLFFLFSFLIFFDRVRDDGPEVARKVSVLRNSPLTDSINAQT